MYICIFPLTINRTSFWQKMTMKDVKEAFLFACTYDFWKMGLFWSFDLFSSYFQLLKARRIFRSKSSPISASINPHNESSRPICVITGVTSGLGKATAFALAEKGFYVVLVGRSSQPLSETLKEIKAKHKDAQLKSFEADMSSFRSIYSLEQWLKDSQLHPSIQLLVNNAGILATSSRPTIEGYDRIMATNYLGPFFLTKLLLPLLKNSSVPSRVVNVTSFTHRSAFLRKFDKDSVTGVHFSKSNQYHCTPPYEYSKLCLVMFSYELHRQLRLIDGTDHISVIAADPGFAKTNLMREFPIYIKALSFRVYGLLGFLQSAEEGAESIIDAAISTPETPGVYYFGGKGRTIESSRVSKDKNLAKQLWETSSDLFNELQILSHNN